MSGEKNISEMFALECIDYLRGDIRQTQGMTDEHFSHSEKILDRISEQTIEKILPELHRVFRDEKGEVLKIALIKDGVYREFINL